MVEQRRPQEAESAIEDELGMDNETINDDDGNWRTVRQKKKTYANIAGGIMKETTGWKTPEHKEKLEIRIAVRNSNKPATTIRAVKKVIQPDLGEQ